MILTEICVGVVEICEDAPDCTTHWSFYTIRY